MRDFQQTGRSAVFATSGICATSSPLSAAIAIDILKQGGNAVDAAIACALSLGLCEPQMTGIGGDCFALIAQPDEDPVAVNGSGRAPKAAHAAHLRAQGAETVGLHHVDAVTLPGAIDAFCTMSDRWGKLDLDQVLAPAIHYMEHGVPLGPRTVFDWRIATGTLQGTARDIYLRDGKAPQVGDLFRLPGQAEVLRRVAKDGRDGFYAGEVAEDMLTSLAKAGGVHTADDFANTRCTVGAPLSDIYKGRELLEHPPNGQGVTAHLLLNILSQFDLASMDPLGADRVHIEAEAAKLAYDARNRFLADPDHMSKLAHLRDPETAKNLAALIDPKRAMAAPAALSEAVHKDTVYLSVVDRDGMAVSLIYSIFHSFGSGIASDKFGILFQNRGAGFTLQEGHPNELMGGKRPMHTIIPALLRDNGRVSLPFGVMGGQYQPNGHARVVTNLTDYGMELQEALDAPRSFADGGQLQVERGYSDAVRRDLTERGHDVVIPETAIGGAQAIQIHESGVLEGASDPRKDGCAIGY
jgi:gamma-glutamyltranspeptidase/glutathione hydrolase